MRRQSTPPALTCNWPRLALSFSSRGKVTLLVQANSMFSLLVCDSACVGQTRMTRACEREISSRIPANKKPFLRCMNSFQNNCPEIVPHSALPLSDSRTSVWRVQWCCEMVRHRTMTLSISSALLVAWTVSAAEEPSRFAS